MGKNLRLLPPFNGVQAGAWPTCKIPVTEMYSAVFVAIQHDSTGMVDMSVADMKTHIERIKLTISNDSLFGTQTIWDISGANYIDCILEHYDIPVVAGMLPLVFALPYFDNPLFEDGFSLGTLDLTSVQLSIKLSSSVASPTLEATGEYYDTGNKPLGQIIRLSESSHNAPNIGDLDLRDLPIVGPGVGLKAIHFTTEDIGKIQVQANTVTIHEDSAVLRDLVSDMRSFRTAGRIPQTGYTHLDMAGNRAGNIKDTSAWRNLLVKLDMTGTGAFQSIHENVIHPAKLAS